MRNLPLLAALLVTGLVVIPGCAAIPVTPPLAEDLPDSEPTYTWRPMTWRPGERLSYRTAHFTEILAEGVPAQTSGSRGAIAFEALDRTARGLTRVAVSQDGRSVGTFLVDEEGRARDAIGETPEQTKELANLVAGFHIGTELWGRPLTVNQRVTLDVDWPQLLLQLPTGKDAEPGKMLKGLDALVGTIECAFRGYKRLGGARVAAIGCETVRSGAGTVMLDPSFLLDHLSVVAVSYYPASDPGYLVESFTTFTLGGETKDRQGRTRRLTGRATVRMTLDRRP
jgi:hypothetical protein